MSSAFIVRGDDGEEYGPVSFEELREWVRENRAGLGTTVRADEPGALWQPWQYYPELVALLAEKQAVGLGAGVILAPMFRRMVAMIVDLILVYILMVPIVMVIFFAFIPGVFVQWVVAIQQSFHSGQMAYVAPDWVSGLFNLIFFSLVLLYMAGFHALHGRTPAKSILRVQVVDQHGTKPTFNQALVRGLVLIFSLCLLGLPLLWAFINPQRRALHDLMAGTYVVEL